MTDLRIVRRTWTGQVRVSGVGCLVPDLDEIEIAEYDLHWPVLYKDERLRIVRVLRDSVTAIEHMGSTAVPGLAAKPIIDVVASVHGPPLSEERMTALESIGFGHWRDNGPWWGFCRKGTPRRYHLHLIDVSGDEGRKQWELQLLFRDYLRAHPHDARRYEALKRGVADRFATDWEAYEESKTEFVEACLEKADRWRGIQR